MPRCNVCKMQISDSLNARKHCDTKEKARPNIVLARSKNPTALLKRRKTLMEE